MLTMVSHNLSVGGGSCPDDENELSVKHNKMKHNEMRYACIIKLNNRIIPSIHFDLRKEHGLATSTIFFYFTL